MRTALQVERIKQILGNPNVKHCENCGKSWIPFDLITTEFCPHCQQDEIIDLEDDMANLKQRVSVLGLEQGE